MKLVILKYTERFVMKHPRISIIIFTALIAFVLLIGSCANPQAVNFSKQIMKRAHCVDAIVELKAKDVANPQDNELTETELRYILQSGFESVGKTEKEANAEVEKLLGGK